MSQLKFKKSESFYIRDGWFEKALNTINENPDNNIFHKNDGIKYLGIGSNMVKGLKYWLQASNIIEGKNNTLTDFARLILAYDQYFESDFVWYLIHYKLSTNKEYCPLFYSFFNSNILSFNKNLLANYFSNYFKNEDNEINEEYIESDLSVFLKSYINEEIIENPEDNYVCPLSSLNLIKRDGDLIKKVRPLYSTLSYLIIYYALTEKYKYESFKIEDSFNDPESPYLIFNLDKNTYLQYLDEMRNNGLIIINKTAGLNIVYFEGKHELKDLFEMYFRG